MLLTRVLTALALLPVILGLLFFAPPAAWALFALLLALLACWEWSRMCGFTPGAQSAYLAASGAIGAYVWLMAQRYVPGNFAALALTSFRFIYPKTCSFQFSALMCRPPLPMTNANSAS